MAISTWVPTARQWHGPEWAHPNERTRSACLCGRWKVAQNRDDLTTNATVTSQKCSRRSSMCDHISNTFKKNLSPLIYTEYTLRCGNEEPIWPVIKLWNWSDAHLKSSKTTTWIHDTLTRHLTKAHRFDEIWPRAAPCRRCSHTWTTWPLRCLPKCLGQSSHNFYRDTSCSWFGRGVSFQLWGFFGGVHVSLWECSCNWTWQWPEDFWSHRDYHWKGSLPNAPS